jgi:hypothetical protein
VRGGGGEGVSHGFGGGAERITSRNIKGQVNSQTTKDEVFIEPLYACGEIDRLNIAPSPP